MAIDQAPDLDQLRSVARSARVEIVRAVAHAGAGHVGGPLSAVEILTALYFDVMSVDPDAARRPDRDRFVLSKGHSSIALYAILALRGFLPLEELVTFDAIDSRLQGHPDMTRLPSLDMSTGSLGVGFSAAVGMAIGVKRQRMPARIFALLGDGECQEGQVWEAADCARRYQLDNLIAIVDVNELQQFGRLDGPPTEQRRPWPGHDLADVWAGFGWRVSHVDGHDLRALIDVLRAARQADDGVPHVVLARTTKGRGVSFMEDRFEWHARVPNEAELAAALLELQA